MYLFSKGKTHEKHLIIYYNENSQASSRSLMFGTTNTEIYIYFQCKYFWNEIVSSWIMFHFCRRLSHSQKV